MNMIYLVKGWMHTKTRFQPFAELLKGRGWHEVSEAEYNAIAGIVALTH